MTASRANSAPPPCPITGKPATRLIQDIPRSLLIYLWRYSGRVELGHLLGGKGPIRFWESPCGLAFFDPMIEGDGALYPAFYRNTFADRWLLNDPGAERAEFQVASTMIGAGEQVLDVGCGQAAFARHVPHARYVGLDPYAPASSGPEILRRDIHTHAAEAPEAYDAVCAFQVLEHSAEPLAVARAMVRALRPGGLFFVGVPSWPSPLVEIPNFPANAPPHHLTWWTPAALRALCDELGLDVVSTGELPPQRQHKLIHWMAWFSPIKARGPYYRKAWSWHLSGLLAFLLAAALGPVLKLPPKVRSLDCFVAARKPR